MSSINKFSKILSVSIDETIGTLERMKSQIKTGKVNDEYDDFLSHVKILDTLMKEIKGFDTEK